MIASKVIQYRVREKVKVRKQEIVEEVKCFRYWEVGHYKWKYPNIEKRRRNREEAACVAKLQKAQQERRPEHPIWKKVQEYYREESMPPKGALLLERGWITKEVVVMYMDCRGYKGKGVQTYKNQGQGFLLERQVRNMQCGLY